MESPSPSVDSPLPEARNGPRPLPLVLAVLVLLVALGIGWYMLTLQTGGIGGSIATSTPTGPVSDHEDIHDTGAYYDIQATYPTATPLTESAGASANAKAVTIMKTFVTQEIARFKDSTIADLTPEDAAVQGLGDDRKYALGIMYKAYASAATVSYVFQMYQDTLGAHPNAYYRTFVFSRTTGDGLTLADVFSPTADYPSVLSNESRTRLPALLKERTGYDPDPDMLSAGTTPDADNFQTFYLSGTDLVIIFPPYQVAAYAAGTTELHIPLSALGNAIRPAYR